MSGQTILFTATIGEPHPKYGDIRYVTDEKKVKWLIGSASQELIDSGHLKPGDQVLIMNKHSHKGWPLKEQAEYDRLEKSPDNVWCTIMCPFCSWPVKDFKYDPKTKMISSQDIKSVGWTKANDTTYQREGVYEEYEWQSKKRKYTLKCNFSTESMSIEAEVPFFHEHPDVRFKGVINTAAHLKTLMTQIDN